MRGRISGDVLRDGFEDFGAYRTDVIFLCLLYRIIASCCRA